MGSSHNNVEMLHDDVEDSSDNHLSNDVEDSSNDNDGPKVTNEPVISSEESSRSQSPPNSDSGSASVHPGDMNSDADTPSEINQEGEERALTETEEVSQQ